MKSKTQTISIQFSNLILIIYTQLQQIAGIRARFILSRINLNLSFRTKIRLKIKETHKWGR